MTTKKPNPPKRQRNGTLGARLSFRSTDDNLDKLMRLAKRHKWTNGAGKPNVSAVLNYIIERYGAKETT